MRRTLLAALALSIALLPGWLPDSSTAHAQDVSKKLNNKTYVGEEAEFVDDLAQARLYELRGDYAAALDLYQEIIERADGWLTNPPPGQAPRTVMTRYTDYETTLEEGSRGIGYHGQLFIPVVDYVLEKISELPTRWRDLYRESVESIAKLQLEEARDRRDRAGVQRVADRYWLSASGGEALDLAAELAYEAGDFQVAIYYWDRMRVHHAAAFGRDKQRIVRFAAAAWQVGDVGTFADALRDAERKFDGFPAVLGRERASNLLDLMNDEQFARRLFGDAPVAWLRGMQRFNGNDRHSRPSAHFNTMLRAWTPIEVGPWFTNERQGRMMVRPGQVPNMETRNLLTIAPACWNGRLVVHGPRQGVIQLLESAGDTGGGATPPAGSPFGRRFAFDVQPALRNQAGNRGAFIRGMIPNRSYIPTIHEGKLYCVFHPGDHVNRGRVQQQGDVLACFPLWQNGGLTDGWVTPSNEADDPNIDIIEDLSRLEFSAAPAYGNGLLFVGASRIEGREMSYEVLAFNADTGKVAWRCQEVASQLSETMGFQRFQVAGPEVAPITYDGGFVLFQTNAGALVSVDGLTGQVRWTFRYRRPDNTGGVNQFRGQQQQTTTQWYNNPPIAHRGVGYFTPTDSEKLVVLDVRSGEFLRSWPDEDRSGADYEYMLGVSHDVLHIQGRTMVSGINLAYDHPQALDGGKDRLLGLAYETVAYSGNENELRNPDFVRGRGVLTRDAIYVPTSRGLVRYNARTGKRESARGDQLFMEIPDVNPEHFGHLFVITDPDWVPMEGSPNRVPNTHLMPGVEGPVPADRPGEDGQLPADPRATSHHRTFLLIASGDRISVVEVE